MTVRVSGVVMELELLHLAVEGRCRVEEMGGGWAVREAVVRTLGVVKHLLSKRTSLCSLSQLIYAAR